MMRKLLFVGLGNPGKRYEHTRHNLGVMVLRAWVESKKDAVAQEWRAVKDWHAETALLRFDDAQNISVVVTCLVPLTGMNESGKAVAVGARELSVEASDIIIIHDDLELAVGEVRWKQKGSAGGHKGVRSIQESLKTQDIPRLRLGIGRPPEEVLASDFVLQELSREEQSATQSMIMEACRMLDTIL